MRGNSVVDQLIEENLRLGEEGIALRKRIAELLDKLEQQQKLIVQLTEQLSRSYDK